MKRDKIVLPCDRRSNETVTLGKHVTKYKHMQKWMVEFLIKIARVKSIRITKSICLLQFCAVLGVRCDIDIFKLTAVRSPLKYPVKT